MPEISRFLGIVIAMYYRDHAPPHFHALYGEHEVTISIATGEVNGDFPKRALAHVQETESILQSAASYLHVPPTRDVLLRLLALIAKSDALQIRVTSLNAQIASSKGDALLMKAVDLGGLKVLAARLDGADAKTLRETLDKLKDKLKSAVVVLAAVDAGRVQLAAGVPSDKVGSLKAGELVNFVAQQVGGKGGGKADLAMAGGSDPAGLDAALASVQGWVAQRI